MKSIYITLMIASDSNTDTEIVREENVYIIIRYRKQEQENEQGNYELRT